MFKKLIFLLAAFVSIETLASGAGVHLQDAHVDITDQSSLQRGAKMFMNYCSGCHSLKFLRYSQLAKGLKLETFDGALDKNLLFNNLVFTKSNVGDPIKIAMPPQDSREWFGKVPPDLSLVARVRGSNWLYTYLKSFYQDPSKTFGSNNLVFPDVSMPNVLAPLQGIQEPEYKTKSFIYEGKTIKTQVITHLTMAKDGSMSEHQFDSVVKDIVTFLTYVGEPVKQQRQWLGIWVIAFMLVLTALFYALKKSFWSELKK